MTITNKLTEVFLDKMQSYLQENFQAFLASYKDERTAGYRRNPLKATQAEFEALMPFSKTPVPWAKEGYYLNEGDRPGKHPYYHAGLYYIQEPSAMAPVELLDVRPGDRVLDLCGAPGGKTTQVAGKLQGRGLVVANDNHPDRVKAMVKNIELLGVTNAVVLNELPERLVGSFAEYFDKILVDAPCSGEGMFRKEPEMAKDWSPDEVLKYAAMQIDIITSAAKLLKPGGRLVYSTCTFSVEENEGTIARFLEAHPGFRVEAIELRDGFAPGMPEWLGPLRSPSAESTRGAARLWPHMLRGEGHFVAVLTKEAPAHSLPRASGEGQAEELVRAQAPPLGLSGAAGALAQRGQPLRRADARGGRHGGGGGAREAGGNSGNGGNNGNGSKEQGHKGRGSQGVGTGQPQGQRSVAGGASMETIVERFWSEHIRLPFHGQYTNYGDFVYKVPEGLPDLAGLKVARPGWFLGTVRKERFEPSQALAMGLTAARFVRLVNLPASSPDVLRYLRGETLHLPEEALTRAEPSVAAKGYTIVCLDGYPMGWAKWQDGMLKNEYPPGWRWT